MISTLVTTAVLFSSTSFQVSNPAALAVTQITCAARTAEVTAKIQFVKSVDDQGRPSLIKFHGSFAIPEQTVDLKYDYAQIQSNPKYRPIKYKDSVQFKNILSTSTAPGSTELSIDLQLIVPNSAFKNSGPFQSVLLARAEQGGTQLILNCR